MNRGGRLFTLLFSTSLASLVVFAQGCSSSSSSTASGACANYVAALRDSAKECGRFNVSPTRESVYLARFQRSCEAVLAAPGSGISPGVLDQCAAALRSSCGDDDACEELVEDVRGTLADGTACDDDTQCASGECGKELSSQSTPRCGRCVPAVAIGQPCPDGGCVAGAVCVSTGDLGKDPVCIEVRTANEGEACGTGNGSEAVRCPSGLYCRYDIGASGAPSGTCERPLAEGSSCAVDGNQNARCAPPFTCVNDRCGRLLGAGQTCSQSNDCASGLACDPANKTCTAIVWGANGSVCDDEVRRCDRGVCARTADTAPGATGTCVDFIADGQPCDERKADDRCDVNARCLDGTCQFEDPSLCK